MILTEPILKKALAKLTKGKKIYLGSVNRHLCDGHWQSLAVVYVAAGVASCHCGGRYDVEVA